ncbi:hypothetical protein WA158_005277 [Blastocystis sp. Blastoise]
MSPNENSVDDREKQKEFKNYLEQTGFMSSLTSGLTALYDAETRPNDPLELLQSALYPSMATEMSEIHEKYSTLKDKIALLEAELAKNKSNHATWLAEAEAKMKAQQESEKKN